LTGIIGAIEAIDDQMSYPAIFAARITANGCKPLLRKMEHNHF
jgi:hypothetical protein